MSLDPAPIDVQPYTAACAPQWNALVADSPNATFLFDRGYMDYHADRFDDASLLLWQAGRLLALLPAHRVGDEVHSHGGLSYGGLVLARALGVEAVLALLQAVQRHLAAQGVRALRYKTVPVIYHRRPCEADRYALFRLGARLVRRDALSVIGPGEDQWSPAESRPITRTRRTQPLLALEWACGAEADWAGFWPVLAAQLQARHATRPVHTLAEIEMLAARFPRQIHLHLARWAGEPVAGLVVYETATVHHAQYMAAGPLGRRSSALDLLVERAVLQARAAGCHFDFGHSNLDEGRTLNTGLAFYKESFGASTVVHDHYHLDC